MQEIITYIIGVIVAFFIGRYLWQIAKGRNKSGCTSCDGCDLRNNCGEREQ
ncbi:MAG: FeoB-associated Cys-rich membrane protein [Rikenellaceae bacterium]